MERSLSVHRAHRWCDSLCGRCTLADACKACSSLDRRRWQHLQAGEDPDHWEVIFSDVRDNLRHALVMLVELAEQQGIGLDDLDDSPAPGPADQQLISAGWEYFKAAHALSEACGSSDDQAARLKQASLVYVKLSRITAMAEPDDELWLEDSAPNLLLIERLEAEVTAAVGQLVKSAGIDPARYLEARATLMARLKPHLQRIPHRLRRAMDDLIEARKAPSPFCTCTRPRRPGLAAQSGATPRNN